MASTKAEGFAWVAITGMGRQYSQPACGTAMKLLHDHYYNYSCRKSCILLCALKSGFGHLVNIVCKSSGYALVLVHNCDHSVLKMLARELLNAVDGSQWLDGSQRLCVTSLTVPHSDSLGSNSTKVTVPTTTSFLPSHSNITPSQILIPTLRTKLANNVQISLQDAVMRSVEPVGFPWCQEAANPLVLIVPRPCTL